MMHSSPNIPAMDLRTDSKEKIKFTIPYDVFSTNIGLSFQAVSDPSKILELGEGLVIS